MARLKREDSICEAYANGYCEFGCDIAQDHMYKAEKMIEENNFTCYSPNKECQILKEYRNKCQMKK